MLTLAASKTRHAVAPAAAATVRLPPGLAVGASQHRSGWPFALASFRPLIASHGLRFDDFVERTFCYGPPGAWEEPWVGMFHHPPSMPAFSLPGQTPQELFRLSEFRRSLPHLVRRSRCRSTSRGGSAKS